MLFGVFLSRRSLRLHTLGGEVNHMVIFKYPLFITDRQWVPLPKGAKILDVQVQDTTPCVWALVDQNAPVNHETVTIYGTGNPVPEKPGLYIATFQSCGGVWHVFLEGKE